VNATARRARFEARRLERASLTDPGPVTDAAAAFLGVRPRSIAETRERLVQLGYPHRLVEEVLASLVETGYLDDEGFARAWVESRDRARPRGASALRRELALKGVAREVVDVVLAEREGGVPGEDVELRAARVLLARRRAALEREVDPQGRRRKAYALLARNGFDPDTCREAVAAFSADAEES
jgi:regulatory protein